MKVDVGIILGNQRLGVADNWVRDSSTQQRDAVLWLCVSEQIRASIMRPEAG